MLFVKRLHAHFRQAFGRPHDVGRIDGLIAGDEDELAGAVSHARFSEPQSPQSVVFDGLARLRFHHRHVLVRCGVEDGIRLMLLKDAFQSRLVLDVSHQRDDPFAVTGVNQLLFDLKQLHL